MIKVNALKIDIETEKGRFGLEEEFIKGLNFISSSDNTQGKSTSIEAIYYCLGLEELLGGQNEKALKPVLRSKLEYDKKIFNVLQSDIFLEIENSKGKIITIKRSVKNTSRDSKLITVYDSKLKYIFKKAVKFEDMYVHDGGAAVNDKGFHKFLEEFIGWNLPLVPTFDGVDRKLYIQTLFSAFFVEQKRGWADIMATLPTKFKIKDASKRVIEFILGLDILENERKKQECNVINRRIKQQWEEIVKNIRSKLFTYNCTVHNLPANPEILKESFLDTLLIMKRVGEGDELTLVEYVERCKNDICILEKQDLITVGVNVDDLEIELSQKTREFDELELQLFDERKKLVFEKVNLDTFRERLHIIKEDLTNNRDVLKLKNMGSTQEWQINKEICPTCQQRIHDCLLPQEDSYNLMTIDDNIKYLEAQKEMMEFTVDNQNVTINDIKQNIATLEAKIYTVQKVIRSIKNDLKSNESNISEAFVRKKFILENEIEKIQNLINEISDMVAKLLKLSEQWKTLQDDIAKLPKDYFTDLDNQKLIALRDYLRKNIQEFGYSSINPFEIDISKDKYLPTIEGFDMKFDSSASDSIRAIWAYTVALYQTAQQFDGKHACMIIFDEPAQHSIVVGDMIEFFNKILSLKGLPQVFIGITMNDKSFLNKLVNQNYRVLHVDDWAIKPIKQSMKGEV
ncbi:MAG: hypothetical protein GX660_22115 [Clostridiaceae bacterium]|nr:hypothetical protein [Clostridiaceae bacterium]